MPLSRLKIRLGYLIAFMLLLVSYSLIFYIIGLQVTESKEVTHSYTVINNLESLKSNLIDAETGVRGFVLTKDEKFLEPYNQGAKNVIPLYKELDNLTRDNISYRSQLDSLGSLITRRMEFLSFVITDFRRNNFELSDQLKANRENARNVMDSIRMYVAQLKEGEQKLMNKRNEKLNSIFLSTEFITVVSLLIALCTIFYSVMIYNAGNRARIAADKQAKDYSQQLEERVAELKKVNTELEALKSLEKFTSTGRIARTIAHEVRNPLTNISLASEQLKDWASQTPDAEILLDMIGRNSERINQLVSDLLNSTRFAQLEFKNADLNELLDETLKMAADRVELKKAIIKKDYDRNLCQVSVDQEKIKLAFLNIIVNALEAIEDDKGILEISTYREGDNCVVRFADNGTGMDADTLQKLFDPYFSIKPKGNGLGLTNTQNIVLNHKGNIKVRSTPGKGTTFMILLPVYLLGGN